MQRFRFFLSSRSQLAWKAVVAIGILWYLFIYRLGSLTHGLHPAEQLIGPSRTLLHALTQDPLYLPLQLPRIIVSLTPYHGITAARISNVALGLLALALFIYLVRTWYGRRAALYGGVMLATAPWFLHISRLATTDILYPLIVLCLFAFYSFSERPLPQIVLWLSPVVLAVTLYVPGAVWLIVLSLFLEGRSYQQLWLALGGLGKKLLWLILCLAPLGLLAYSLWQSPHLVRTWLGIPAQLPVPLTIVENCGRVWWHIFVRGPQSSLVGLGLLPLVNVFTAALVLVGAYFYATHIRAGRTILLASFAALGTVLSALNGPVSSAVLLPVIFILATGGLGYLLREWLRVFPRNPIARGVGITMVVLALSFSSLYNLRLYFIAWPHNSVVRASFQRHNL